MENCKICGKEIENVMYTIYIGEEKIEKVCKDCGFNTYKISKNDNEFTKESKSYFNELLILENISEDSKLLINLILNSKAGDIRTQAIGQHQNEHQVNSDNLKTSVKTGWAYFVKIMSMIEIVLFSIIGAVIASALASYGDEEAMFSIIGAVVGGTVGCILMSINMLIAEIAENIATGVDLLKLINSKTKK